MDLQTGKSGGQTNGPPLARCLKDHFSISSVVFEPLQPTPVTRRSRFGLIWFKGSEKNMEDGFSAAQASVLPPPAVYLRGGFFILGTNQNIRSWNARLYVRYLRGLRNLARAI